MMKKTSFAIYSKWVLQTKLFKARQIPWKQLKENTDTNKVMKDMFGSSQMPWNDFFFSGKKRCHFPE